MSRGKSNNTLSLQDKVISVTEALSPYWPLTLRQIYYQLVAAGHLENHKNRYKALSGICSDMRKDGLLSWAVMEDRTRRLSGKRGWTDVAEFIAYDLSRMFQGYDRCLVQQQTNYVELWVEKDALSRIFEDAAWPYCVNVVTCKGQVSTTFLKSYADRAASALKRGQHSVVCYGGDLDPSGWKIPLAAQATLKNDFGIEVEFDRFVLNLEQVEQYKLPRDPDALKWSDGNARKFVDIYGEIAVELDALAPAILEAKIVQALERHLDTDSMEAERGVEWQERQKLKALRRDFIEHAETRGYRL